MIDVLTLMVPTGWFDGLNPFPSLTGEILKGIYESLGAPLGDLTVSSSRLWIEGTYIPLDSPTGKSIQTMVVKATKYIAALTLFASLVIGGVKIAWNQRGEEIRTVLAGILTFVFVSSAWSSIVVALTMGSDELAKWIFETFGSPYESKVSTFFGRIVAFYTLSTGAGGILFFFIIVFLGVLIGLFIQTLMCSFRAGLLIIMTGLGPVAAAGASTRMGREWMQKLMGWTLALILYKPVGALIWAAAFQLCSLDTIQQAVDAAKAGGSDEFFAASSAFMAIIALMVMSLIALPTLMKLFVPATSGIAGGGVGGAVAGSASGLVATGASMAMQHRASKGGATAAAAGATKAGAAAATGGTSMVAGAIAKLGSTVVGKTVVNTAKHAAASAPAQKAARGAAHVADALNPQTGVAGAINKGADSFIMHGGAAGATYRALSAKGSTGKRK